MLKRTYNGEIIVEARRYPRKPLKMKLKYRTLIPGESARLEVSHSLADDLGAKGLAIRGRHALKKGQLLTLSLFLPPEDQRREQTDLDAYKEEECVQINILARVAWSKPVGEDQFQMGVEFLDLEPKDRKPLKSFLVDYKLDDFDSPLYS